jgi:hypothetical protein
LRLAQAINLYDGAYWAPSPNVGSALQFERLLLHAGFDDDRAYADVAKSQADSIATYYFDRKAIAGSRLVEILLAGCGRWSMLSYGWLFVFLYFLTLATFWNAPSLWSLDGRPPESEPDHDQAAQHWVAYRLVFAVAMLLPGMLNLGVDLRPRDGYYWDKSESDATRLTIAFHWLRVVGWLFAALLAYAIGLRVK